MPSASGTVERALEAAAADDEQHSSGHGDAKTRNCGLDGGAEGRGDRTRRAHRRRA